MAYSDAVKKLYEAKRQKLASTMAGSPVMSGTFSALNREQQLGMNIARTIDARLQYLQDIYNQSLNELKQYNKDKMLGEIAQSFGELAGAVTPYISDYIKYRGVRSAKSGISPTSPALQPRTTNRTTYELNLLNMLYGSK